MREIFKFSPQTQQTGLGGEVMGTRFYEMTISRCSFVHIGLERGKEVDGGGKEKLMLYVRTNIKSMEEK